MKIEDKEINQHQRILEVEAYDTELAESKDSGLSVSEIQELERRRKDNYQYLGGWYKIAADHQTYDPNEEIGRAIVLRFLGKWLEK